MGNLLFNRAAMVTVGEAKTGGIQFGSVPRKVADNDIYVQGLRVTFDIEKTSSGTANTSKISIYNASADSRAQVEREGLKVFLEAGYSAFAGEAPTIELLFVGDVKKSYSKRIGPDIITTFEAGDSETLIQEATINKSYAPGSTVLQVVKDLASELKAVINIEALTGLPFGIFQHGFTASGSVKKTMDELTSRMGFSWSIQDGELKILKHGVPTAEVAIVLTSDTGLLGEPSTNDDGMIEVLSLLRPSARPGRILALSSSKLTGSFKILKVIHEGDSHEGNWHSKIEAEPF